ncbi:hypothetical protein [Saliphagus sp. LR7]|uniref:hypothetical protein n=1 Tax=Saliphagus sp. LR7 TaxID=2282654 RepID=UPI0013004411|nr:hypothetical protein [Saliphagus sp. LR7]
MFATLDRFADLVPSIVLTEYDTWGEKWTEAMEAAYLRRFLKAGSTTPLSMPS